MEKPNPTIKVVVLTPEELDKIHENHYQRLLELMTSPDRISNLILGDKYVRKEKVMESLGVKNTWMHEREKEGFLKPIKYGRKTLYLTVDVENLIDNLNKTQNAKY